MNTVGVVDDDDLLALWELSQEPSSFCRYLASLNARDIVRVLKVLVVFISGVLPGDHYCIVLAWVSTVINVSRSQDCKLLILGLNLASEPSVVELELPRVFLRSSEVVVT